MLSPRTLEVRVATGTSDRRLASGQWRIWKARNSDDIYIAIRSLAGSIKCALHQTGWCYFGFTDVFGAKLREQGKLPAKGRAWTTWQRPDVFEKGWCILAEIWFPPSPLGASIEPSKKPVWLIEPPPLGKASVISIVLSKFPEGELNVPPGTRELAYCKLSSGYFVAVFARPADFDFDKFKQEHILKFQKMAANWRFAEGGLTQLDKSDTLRMFVLNEPREEGGLVKFLDAAVRVNSKTDHSVELSFQ